MMSIRKFAACLIIMTLIFGMIGIVPAFAEDLYTEDSELVIIEEEDISDVELLPDDEYVDEQFTLMEAPIFVCEVVGGASYEDIQDAVDAISIGGEGTIKLLRSFETYGGLSINGNKKITLDLNGYILDVYRDDFDGLYVFSGKLFLADPYNGELNFYVEGDSGNGVLVSESSEAEVTNITCSSKKGNTVYIDRSNAKLTVYGDVIYTGEEGVGVLIQSSQVNNVVIVEGIISISSENAGFIDFGGTQKEKDDKEALSLKPGFYQYTYGLNSVFIRDPSAPVEITGIAGLPSQAVVGESLMLTGTVVPALAGEKTIIWSVENAGTTGAVISGNVFTAAAAGTAEVKAVIPNSKGDGIEFEPIYFNVTVISPSVSLFSISPSHAILANTSDKAVFTASFEPLGSGVIADIVWNVDDASAVSYTPQNDGESLEVQAIDFIDAKTVLITATYGEFSATATVEIIPLRTESETETVFDAVLLDNKATVNKLKYVGALVPILITTNLSSMSLSDSELYAAGSEIVDKIELIVTDNSPKNHDGTAVGYKAEMYGLDDRYIAISTISDNAKNATVKVMITPKTGIKAIYAGTLKLTVAAKYPKITLKTDVLNMIYPDSKSTISAASDDGEPIIVRTFISDDQRIKKESGKEDVIILGDQQKTGSYKVTVELEIPAEYKVPPYKSTPTVTIKVINSVPNVKLSSSSVNLLPPGKSTETIKLQLVTGDKKVQFESGYKVKDVEAVKTDAKDKAVPVNDDDISVLYDNGYIYITPKSGCKPGKALLKVVFEDTAVVRYLPLTVSIMGTVKSPVKPSSKVKSITLNSGHEPGKIIDIPITVNASNFIANDWTILSVNGVEFETSALNGVISSVSGYNILNLTFTGGDITGLLNPGNGADKKYTLTVGSDKLNAANDGRAYLFSVTLTVTKKAEGISLSSKGKIDIASPGSAITVTAKLSNTTSEIRTARIIDASGGAESKDFKTEAISGNGFRIVAAHKEVVPGVEQRLIAEIVLRNGMRFEKNIKIKPTQTLGKAKLTKKSVTLYPLTPLTGETLGIYLTTPANVNLAKVQINEKNMKDMKLIDADTKNPIDAGFRIEQRGANEWVIYFKVNDNNKAPLALNKEKPVKLKSSYTLKIELWADGTYYQSSGLPLKDNKGIEKSKPTTVNVKVNIK